MNEPQPSNSKLERIVLPSGREIEVLTFDLGAEVQPSTEVTKPADTAQPSKELQICPSCSRDLVHPIDWREVGDGVWEVSLWCPNCYWSHKGEHTQATVDRFDEALDSGLSVLVDDLQRLSRANMEEHVERFVHALNADAVWLIDF